MHYLYQEEQLPESDTQSDFVSLLDEKLHISSIPSVGIKGLLLSKQEADEYLAMRESQRLNQEWSIFLRALVHDLKAPSRQIQSFTGVIRSMWEQGDKEKILGYFQYIELASEEMTALIEGLQRFVKIDSDKPLHNASLESMFANIKSDPAFSSLDAHSLPSVEGDEELLAQLFTELLKNAFYYNQSEKIEVSVISEEMKGGKVKITVSDNGIGIAEDMQNEIFKPFKRLHSSIDYKGTGLGLAIAQKIAQLHQSRVQIESSAGVGSKFSIVLAKAS